MTLTKEDIQVIKSIVDESVKDLKADVENLKKDINGLEAGLGELKDRVTKIEVAQMENDLGSKVKEITSYQ